MFEQIPESPRGAVVVCHGGGGRSPHEREVVDRLAALGYAAVAPDLYGAPPSIELVKSLVAEPTELRRRVLAAVDGMRVHGRVAVMGHCFGGTAALEAARSGADLACAVAFHGGLAAPSRVAAGGRAVRSARRCSPAAARPIRSARASSASPSRMR